ncbi:MAG: hypothetical protein HY303_01060 [Candidatus Wallbacteria bacterium]|nr:hypothetical protein [Candidatus Wallbacteria bacterium]
MRFKEDRASRRGVEWIESPPSSPSPGPQAYVGDFTSQRAWIAYALALVFGILALQSLAGATHGRYTGPSFGGFAVFALAATVCAAWRMALSDYRIVDARSRRIWLHRSFLGFKTLTPEASFDELASVGLNAVKCDAAKTHGAGYEWTLEARTKDGRTLQLGDAVFWELVNEGVPPAIPPRLRSTAERVAQMLGRRLDLPAIVAQPSEDAQKPNTTP